MQFDLHFWSEILANLTANWKTRGLTKPDDKIINATGLQQTSQYRRARYIAEVKTHLRGSGINYYKWTHQFWPTSKYLYSSVLCRHWMPQKALTDWCVCVCVCERERERESQGNSTRHDDVWWWEKSFCGQHIINGKYVYFYTSETFGNVDYFVLSIEWIKTKCFNLNSRFFAIFLKITKKQKQKKKTNKKKTKTKTKNKQEKRTKNWYFFTNRNQLEYRFRTRFYNRTTKFEIISRKKKSIAVVN